MQQQYWLATNSPERNLILLLSRQAAKKPILKKRICKYFNFEAKKYVHFDFSPWVGSGCPPPHLGWMGCLLSA